MAIENINQNKIENVLVKVIKEFRHFDKVYKPGDEIIIGKVDESIFLNGLFLGMNNRRFQADHLEEIGEVKKRDYEKIIKFLKMKNRLLRRNIINIEYEDQMKLKMIDKLVRELEGETE